MDAVNLKSLTGLTTGIPARVSSSPKVELQPEFNDHFGEDDDAAFAFLEGWSKQDAPSVQQLADAVPAAPPPPAPMDAASQIELLVRQNRDVFAKCNAPTSLLMSDEPQPLLGSGHQPSDHAPVTVTWLLSDGRG